MFDPVSMSADWLVATVAAILALLFDYLPGLSGWFDKQDEGKKKLLMVGMLLVVAFGVFGLSCFNLIDIAIACTWGGAGKIAGYWLVAVIANQSTHALTKPTERLKARLFKR